LFFGVLRYKNNYFLKTKVNRQSFKLQKGVRFIDLSKSKFKKASEIRDKNPDIFSSLPLPINLIQKKRAKSPFPYMIKMLLIA